MSATLMAQAQRVALPPVLLDSLLPGWAISEHQKYWFTDRIMRDVLCALCFLADDEGVVPHFYADAPDFQEPCPPLAIRRLIFEMTGRSTHEVTFALDFLTGLGLLERTTTRFWLHREDVDEWWVNVDLLDQRAAGSKPPLSRMPIVHRNEWRAVAGRYHLGRASARAGTPEGS